MGETEVVKRDAPPLADYAGARSGFSWDAAIAEAGIDTASMNLGMLATERHVAAGRGSHPAIVWVPQAGPAQSITYADFAEWSARAANMLAARGVAKGDVVLFLLPNSPELYAGVLGALRLGAVVSVLGGGRNLDYLRNILSQAKPKSLVTVASFRSSVTALRPQAPELTSVFYVNRAKLSPPALDEGEFHWSDHFEAAPTSFATPATPASERAYIHYTELGMSGGVLSHLVGLPLLLTAKSVLEMRAGEAVHAIALPGEHYFLTYSMLAPLLAGATNLVLETPAQFQRWEELPASVRPRVWFSGAKPLDVMLRTDPNLGTALRDCRNICISWPYDKHFVSMTAYSYGSPLHAVWGERETGALQCAELRGCPIRPGSVGRPLPGAEVQIVDDAGVPLPAGVPGRVAARTGLAAPFVEYWADAELTAGSVRDGWFLTKRTGRIDADGYVWIES
jgi:acetyl-CoA synthetase